jgi:hypothetical protein
MVIILHICTYKVTCESAPSFECAWAARFPCGGGCGAMGDGRESLQMQGISNNRWAQSFKRRKIRFRLEMTKRNQNFKQKILELKNAVKDTRFLDDLQEVSEDFKMADSDGLEFIP